MNWIAWAWGRVFVQAGFNPHSFCLALDPWLIAVTELGDGLTALAYMAIPAQLVFILCRWRASNRLLLATDKRWVLWMFALFIVMCGVSHVLDIVVVYIPVYWFQAAWKCVLGCVSMCTAVMLQFAIIPETGRTYQG